MNGNNILVDTNILIYLLDKDAGVLTLLTNKSVYISFISELELLSIKNYSSSEKRKIDNLLAECTIIDLTPDIKRYSVQHRLKSKLKLPDAIIAATAQYLSLPLLTADKDFNKVTGTDILLYEKV